MKSNFQIKMSERVLFILLMFSPQLCFANVFSVIVTRQTYQTNGVLAAFGDFNADRMVDIFVIDQSGMSPIC